MPHASSRKRCADLAGSVPLRQISNHTAAKDLITIQQALLRATPGRAGCFASLLGPVLPVRARMAGDLTAHHRGATPNQVGDTRLGQARIHPRHDRRTILNTQHPTTAHNQPLQQHCYHTNCLHPMTLPPVPENQHKYIIRATQHPADLCILTMQTLNPHSQALRSSHPLPHTSAHQSVRSQVGSKHPQASYARKGSKERHTNLQIQPYSQQQSTFPGSSELSVGEWVLVGGCG